MNSNQIISCLKHSVQIHVVSSDSFGHKQLLCPKTVQYKKKFVVVVESA